MSSASRSPTRSGSSSSHSRTPSPAPLPFSITNPRPDLPPSTAATSLRKLVALELQSAGFVSTTEDALEELEGVIYAFLGALVRGSHELAELARRTRPTAKDILESCAELGVGGVQELKAEVIKAVPLDAAADFEITYERTRKEDVEPTLGSDDEGDPVTDVLAAPYLPALPSRHSYKQTPVFPKSAIPPPIPPPTTSQQAPSSAALSHLSTLRSRLNDSQLVASSLRNLIRRTGATGRTQEQEGGGQEDDVVDYEGEWYGAVGGGRKRVVKVLRAGGEEEEEEEGRTGVVKRRKWRV